MPTRRQIIDLPLDWLRFQMDIRPADYQPVSLDAAKSRSGRADGTMTRWDAIQAVLNEVRPATALDIGANFGWFSFALAKRGIRTVAVERSERHYRSILYLRQRYGLDDVSVLVGGVEPETVSLLPQADCVLLLSVWHHMVREHGFDAATALLDQIWRRTGKVLFFETGEREMSSKFGLPEMKPNPREWIDGYLTESCVGGTTKILGSHKVPDVFGSTSRTLFAVVR